MIAIFSPQIDFAIVWTLKWFKRKVDRGFFNCFSKYTVTKQSSLLNYVELYSGPEYEIFFKYTYMLKLVFFCFQFGLLMPILFPLTLLGFANLYIFEKVMLVYFYKRPPNYDTKINAYAIKMIGLAPIVGMLFTFWIMGNQ